MLKSFADIHVKLLADSYLGAAAAVREDWHFEEGQWSRW